MIFPDILRLLYLWHLLELKHLFHRSIFSSSGHDLHHLKNFVVENESKLIPFSTKNILTILPPYFGNELMPRCRVNSENFILSSSGYERAISNILLHSMARCAKQQRFCGVFSESIFSISLNVRSLHCSGVLQYSAILILILFGNNNSIPNVLNTVVSFSWLFMVFWNPVKVFWFLFAFPHMWASLINYAQENHKKL